MKPNSIFVIGFIIFLSAACSNDNITVMDTEIVYDNLPTMTVKNLNTIYTDLGKVSMSMKSPLMETFNDAEPSYSVFNKGISVVYYEEGKEDPAATIDADYAKFIDSQNLWELRGEVKVYSNNGTTLETEQLFWDQSDNKDLIYTDKFVKITSNDQIITGNGFESDSRLIKRRIKKVTATLYISLDE